MDWVELSQVVQSSLHSAALDEEIDVPSERRRLISWVRKALKEMGLSPVAEKALLRDPTALMQVAYRGLHANQMEGLARSKDTVCRLILIGIAYGGILQKKHCAFCFRWAAPSRNFCSKHSQGQSIEGSRSEKARNYYVGKKAAATLNRPSSRSLPTVYNHPQIKSIRLAHCLWGAVPVAEKELFQRIRKLIKSSPLVNAHMGGVAGLSNAKLEALLREKLDPLELWPDAWPEKIHLVEEWLKAEKKVVPGKRGRSIKTDQKIQRAEQLALEGKTITEIGNIIGVSRTAIIKWYSRGRAPQLKSLLSNNEKLK